MSALNDANRSPETSSPFLKHLVQFGKKYPVISHSDWSAEEAATSEQNLVAGAAEEGVAKRSPVGVVQASNNHAGGQEDGDTGKRIR